jgi:excisionase family DNA binding protein
MQRDAKAANVRAVIVQGVRLFENPTDLVTVKQAAQALHVSIYRVYRWIYEGHLDAQRLPGAKGGIRLVARDVEGLLRPAYPNAGQVPHF